MFFSFALINKVFITFNTGLIEFYFKTYRTSDHYQTGKHYWGALLEDAKGRVGSRVEEKVHPTDYSAVLETSGCNHGLMPSVHFYIQIPSLSLKMLRNTLTQNIVTIHSINKKEFPFLFLIFSLKLVKPVLSQVLKLSPLQESHKTTVCVRSALVTALAQNSPPGTSP